VYHRLTHHYKPETAVNDKPRKDSRVATRRSDRLGIASRIPALRLLGAAALVAGVTATASAQGSGNGFLFEQPAGSLTLSGGYAHASAGSDIFSFTTNQLSVDKSDFSGLTLGADLAIRVAPRFDIVLGTSYAGTSTPSSYRSLVDQNNQEITQTTDFRRVPVMASVKAYLTDRGRSVGRFAWVPSRFAPYVGVGGGAVWYRFRQHGDFVDANDNSVFTADLNSSSWAPAVQGLAGLDFTLTPHLALTGEAKYIWAHGKLSDSFSGFDNIDLSGLSTTIGLTFRY
jgi:opacity protein-like surface antigen